MGKFSSCCPIMNLALLTWPRTVRCLAASASIFLVAILVGSFYDVHADDWPQWLGPKRDGVWRETGIVEKIPASGLKVVWRTPVHRGYCGPAVAGGRVFLLDRLAVKMPERKRGDRSI